MAKHTNRYNVSHSLAASFDTMSAGFTSIDQMDNGGIILSWSNTGSPVGILEVWVSNDLASKERPPTIWSRLAFSDQSGATVTSVPIDGSATTQNINLNQLGFQWIAYKYIRTSGTGTLLIEQSTKQIGG